MNEKVEETELEARDDLAPGEIWLDTHGLSAKINLATSSIMARLRRGGLASLQQADARIINAEQRVGASRTGFVWRFLWRENPQQELKRIGYFCVSRGERDDVIAEREAAITDTARNLGLSLKSVTYDDFRYSDKPKRLSSILRDNQINCIITDREFSLGGRNAPFVRQILEESGVSLVIAPASGRHPAVVTLSYMDEICRLLINLTLLGEDVDELMGLARLKYKEMKTTVGIQHDPGIT